MSPDELPPDLVRELSDSEKKLKALFDRRDHFNDEGKVYREIRDDLHNKRKAIYKKIDHIRAEKTKLLEEMNAAKARREMFNERARSLIGIKRRRDSEAKDKEPYEDRHTLELELRKLDDLYQTRSHTLQKERDIVKAMEEKRKKLKELKASEPEYQAIKLEAQDKEEQIKEYRMLSDQEHMKVQEIYLKLKEVSEKLDEHGPTIEHLRKEADKKHEEFLKVRKQADSYHEKAMELREKVLALRHERGNLLKDARILIDDQNRKVKEHLEDEDMLDNAADKAVDILFKKGKISL